MPTSFPKGTQLANDLPISIESLTGFTGPSPEMTPSATDIPTKPLIFASPASSFLLLRMIPRVAAVEEKWERVS
nr:hypothetical protein CFP56_77918 [Quercus suber]